MAKYRNTGAPEYIFDCLQYTGEAPSIAAIEKLGGRRVFEASQDSANRLKLETTIGRVVMFPGDWFISYAGAHVESGQFMTCSDAAFKAHYAKAGA